MKFWCSGDSTVLTSQSVSLKAIGIFVDGTSQNLTGVVNWSAGPVFSSPTPGAFTITATHDAINGFRNDQCQRAYRRRYVTAGGRDYFTGKQRHGNRTGGHHRHRQRCEFPEIRTRLCVAGDTNFTTIVTSTTPVTDGVLGQFDPTLLINDLYTIRLTVFDAGGNQTIDETTVQIEGGVKIGQFTLSFIDLQIPMSGIPISVTRTYDSRDKTDGNFGIGWKLSLRTLQIRANRRLGTGWRVDKLGLAFALLPTDAHFVSLRLPNGRIEAFQMQVTPDVSPLVPFPASRLTAKYIARPGTLGRLEALGNNTLSIFSPQPGDAELSDDITGQAYDPDLFRYTSPEGLQYVLSRKYGLQSVTDLNGNTLTINSDGIFHSAGNSILFIRDQNGRITELADPAGNRHYYSYDANGDLRKHIDRNGNTTTFDYDRKHNLLNIEGENGTNYIRNEYDESGRLIRTIDANGESVRYEHDLDANTETVIDRSGGVSEYSYDLDGNVIQSIVTIALGNLTQFSYDEQGNQTARTDALGRTWLAEYDEFGRQTSLR